MQTMNQTQVQPATKFDKPQKIDKAALEAKEIEKKLIMSKNKMVKK